MESKNIIFVGIIIAILFSMNIELQSVKAKPITLDINKAKNPGPGFGDEKIGIYQSIQLGIRHLFHQTLPQRSQSKIKYLKAGLLMQVVLIIN